jgi:hypothetical protein
MADEITMNGYFAVSTTDDKRTINTERFTQAGVGRVANTATVPNDSDLALELGGITTTGLAYFRNLAPVSSPTHVINIGPDSTGLVPAIRLAPQQWCIVWLAAAPYARAEAGTPNLDYFVFQR